MRWLLVVVLTFHATAAAEKPWEHGVSASEMERARVEANRGSGLYAEQRFSEAIVAYRRALAIWDHPAVRYNLAIALIDSGDNVGAYENLARAIAFGAAPLGDDKHREALRFHKIIRGQLVELVVNVSETGAVVVLDGQQLFVAPGSATRVLMPGPHQLVTSKPGFQLDARLVDLRAGTTETLDVRLEPEVARVAPYPGWLAWTLGGGGLAIAAAVVPLHLRARSNFSRFDDRLAETCPSGCSEDEIPDQLADLESRATLQQRLAWSGYLLGGGLVATAVVFAVLERRAPIAVAVAEDQLSAQLRVEF